MRHRTGLTRSATKMAGYARSQDKGACEGKKKKTIYWRYLRSCKLTQVQMTAMLELVSLAGELSSLTVKQWHTPCITFKRVTFMGRTEGRSDFTEITGVPKQTEACERQKFGWEMMKEMVLLDGGATFLRGCQVSPDFSAYPNNKADEMPHIRCSTGCWPPRPPLIWWQMPVSELNMRGVVWLKKNIRRGQISPVGSGWSVEGQPFSRFSLCTA